MKEITINCNSWHYHLVMYYTTFYPHNIKSLCGYIYAVMIGSLVALIIPPIVAMILWVMVVSPMLYMGLGFDNLYLATHKEVQASFTAWLILILMIGAIIGEYYYKECYMHCKKNKDNPPTLWYNIYKSIKDKVCYKIKFTE